MATMLGRRDIQAFRWQDFISQGKGYISCYDIRDRLCVATPNRHAKDESLDMPGSQM